MKHISAAQLNQLCATGEVLARDDTFIRAVRAADGAIWKVFRAKPFPSSAAIWPYARRFVRSARKLAERGVATVRVLDQYIIDGVDRHVVVYDELPGTALRDALASIESGSDACNKLFCDLAAFIADLHARGVYFRSMDFGNVLVLADGAADSGRGFGLIDVAETRFSPLSLTMWRRARNFRPVTSYEIDRAALARFGCERFLEQYLRAASLSARKRRAFLKHIRRLNSHLGAAASSLLARPYNQSR